MLLLSNELADFLGHPRGMFIKQTEIIQDVLRYIRMNDLFLCAEDELGPIIPNGRLRTVLGMDNEDDQVVTSFAVCLRMLWCRLKAQVNQFAINSTRFDST